MGVEDEVQPVPRQPLEGGVVAGVRHPHVSNRRQGGGITIAQTASTRCQGEWVGGWVLIASFLTQMQL